MQLFFIPEVGFYMNCVGLLCWIGCNTWLWVLNAAALLVRYKTILSHLNVIFFHIYSKISAVFLTMALLFRCILAYRLKKRRMSACSSCFFLLAPTFISFKHQWQSDSDWAVFSNDAASRHSRAQPSVQSRGGGHTVLFPLFFLNWK